jgi:cytochrome P450
MNRPAMVAADPLIEDTSIASPVGPLEFLRRVRTDQLTIWAPEVFGRNILYNRRLFLDTFLINKPGYIEHVLLTNHANYGKTRFVRHMLGPLLGEGLLISEGDFWRRQRRIAAPAFHNRRIADFVATMTSCTEATLARWHERSEPFDVAVEMMALTLDIICRTMFSTDVTRDVAAVRRLMDVVVALRPGMLDLFGLPDWLPRHQSKAFRRAITEFEAFVSRLLTARRADAADHGDLLAMLLAARDPETREGMNDKQLRDEILTRPPPTRSPGRGTFWRDTPKRRRASMTRSTACSADALRASPMSRSSNGPAWSSRRPCASTRRRTRSHGQRSPRTGSAECVFRPAR